MKLVNSIYLPDNDTHFKGMTNQSGKYQIDVVKTAFNADAKKTCFIDVGAHVGTWSRQAYRHAYKEIHCFEPVQENFDCLYKNVPEGNYYNVALGTLGTYEMIDECESNSGAWHYRWHMDKYPNQIQRLDTYELAPSLIKIDTQGSECDVVLGAINTIREHSPVIVVEQSTSHAALALLIISFKYKCMARIRNDYVMVKDD